MCGSGPQSEHATGSGLEPRCLILQVVFVLAEVVPTTHRPLSCLLSLTTLLSLSQRVESSLCWEVIDLPDLPTDQL